MFFGINKYADFLNKSYPSLFVFTGVLLSAVPFFCLNQNLTKSVALYLVLLGVALCLFEPAVYRKLLLWSLIGWGSVYCNCYVFNGEESSTLLEGKKEFVGFITDFNAVGNDFGWLKNPKNITVKLTRYRVDASGSWTDCNISAMSTLKNGDTLKFGDNIKVSGYLTEPGKEEINRAFSYRDYLNSQRIKYQLFGKTIKSESVECDAFWNLLFKLRNKSMKLLCSGIDDHFVKNFLVGLVFGCRQGISQKAKELFLTNGVIHILSISGMHIGIIALLLLFAFRFLPINVRYLLIPVFLLFYLFIIGFRPSAVRATVMVSIFCFFRVFFLADKPINNILFAGVVLVLLNPFVIRTAGFQFSFIVASILICSWRLFRSLENRVFEKRSWKLGKRKYYLQVWDKLSIWIFTAVGTCVLASIASAGLTLYYQQKILPIMFLPNFLIIPLMFPLLFLAGVKLLLSWLGLVFMNSILNFLLITAVNLLMYIVSFTNSVNFQITTVYVMPSLILLLYVFILIFLFKQSFFMKVSALVMFMILLLLCCKPLLISKNSERYILKPPGEFAESIICINKMNSSAEIYGCAGKVGYEANNLLKNFNISKINILYLSNSTMLTCRNAMLLLKNYKVEVLGLNINYRKSKYLAKIIKACENEHVEVRKLKLIPKLETFSGSANVLRIKKV